MTAKPTRTINQNRVQNLLDKAAGGCGGALNSFLVFLGDKGGLYATGPYSSGVENAIVATRLRALPKSAPSAKPPTALPSRRVVVPQAKIGR